MRLIVLILALLGPLTVSAATIERPLLFAVKAPGANSPTSYLFGTVHWTVGVKDLPPFVLETFDRADAHYFEMDKSVEFSALEKFLREPHREDLLHYRRQSALLNQFRLLVLYPSLPSLDNELTVRAQRNGHKVLTLETDAIREIGERLDREHGYGRSCRLSDYLEDQRRLDELDQELAALRPNYLALTPDDLDTGPLVPEPDMSYRNQVWMATLIREMSARSAFVSVGVLHLPGPTGLLAELRARGFEVRAVGPR